MNALTTALAPSSDSDRATERICWGNVSLTRLLYTNSTDKCHQLATVRRHSVDNTRRSQRWQHAVKRDTDGKSPSFHTSLAFDAPTRRNIATTLGTEKLKWCGYNRRWTILKIRLVLSTEYTNTTDRRTERRTDRQTPHDDIGRAYV